MVTLEESERVLEARWIEGSDLDARFTEWLPIPSAGGPTSHPVVQHPDRHALPCFGRQRVAECPAYTVVPDDVVLEVDEPLGPVDGIQPGVEGPGALNLQPDGIPAHLLGARGPLQGPDGKMTGRVRLGRCFRQAGRQRTPVWLGS